MKIPIQDCVVNKGRQDVTYKELIEVKPHTAIHKLRISIKSDSYNFQSHAYIDRWNDAEWKRVESIHYSNMQTPHGLVYQQYVGNSMFKADRDALLAKALKIIS